jgi:hypothetical protein
MIDHTPAEQEINVVTGKAFDVTGKRRQTEQHSTQHSSDQTFEIKLSNQKAQPAVVHVLEHMDRENWKITAKSNDFEKKDSDTLDFPVTVPAKGEATLTYSVHYNW